MFKHSTRKSCAVLSITAALTLIIGVSVTVSAAELKPEKIQAALDAAYKKYKDIKEGKNADYIPALAKVDPNAYGIALITTDGKVYTAGDLKTEVSIQSISKVFTMAKVMDESGPDALYNNMGVDATGQVFNSIVAIQRRRDESHG
jgi:glutaminase